MPEVMVISENRMLLKSLSHLLKTEHQIKPRLVYYSADALDSFVAYKPHFVIIDAHVMVPLNTLINDFPQSGQDFKVIVIDDGEERKTRNNVVFVSKDELAHVSRYINNRVVDSGELISEQRDRDAERETRKVSFIDHYELFKSVFVSAINNDANLLNEQLRFVYFETVSTHHDRDVVPQLREFSAFTCELFKFVLDPNLKPSHHSFISIEHEFNEMNRFFTQVSTGLKSRNLSDNVKKSITYVFDHYDKELSLDGMAEHLNISKPYLSRVFKAELGMTFLELLQCLRVFIAKQYLFEYQHNISEISEKVGYLDPHYFSRLFKKHTGLSPKEYREQMRK